MTSFYVGDDPRSVLSIDPAPIAPEDFTGAGAALVAPDGSPVVVPAGIEGDLVTVGPLPANPFPVAGVYEIRITLMAAEASMQVPPVPLVVEATDGWQTLSTARRDWRDAPSDDARLWELLEVAKVQCVAFAPDLGEVERVPVTWRAAQLMQARNVWNASRTDPASQGIGDEGFVIRPFPMDWTVKNMLRPKRAVPVIA